MITSIPCSACKAPGVEPVVVGRRERRPLERVAADVDVERLAGRRVRGERDAGVQDFRLGLLAGIRGHELTGHALAGRLTINLDRVSLEDLPAAWARQQRGAPSRKVVVEPAT